MLTTYWLLETLLVILAVGAGWAVTASDAWRHRNRVFLTATLVMVLAYMVIKGLRWDRGEDYSIYLSYYTGPSSRYMPHEAVYDLTVRMFQTLQAPFWAMTMYLSAFFMLSVMTLTARFRRYAVWALPAMVLLTDYASENLIRQFYAVGFMFFSSALWLHAEAVRDKSPWTRIASWLTLAAVPFVHVTGIIPVTALSVVRLLTLYGHGRAIRHPRVPWVLAAVYGVLCLARWCGWHETGPEAARLLSGFLHLDPSSHWDLYLIDAGQWLTPDRLPYSGSPITVTVKILWPLALILLGYRALSLDYRLSVPYWMCVCSIMLMALGSDIMLVRRMAWWGAVFTPFVAGGALTRCLAAVPYAGFSRTHRWGAAMTFCVLGVCYALTYFTPFIFRWGMAPFSGYAFIWDL